MAKVLHLPEAARLLGVSLATMREWLATGKVPGRRIGRTWLIPEGPLLEYLSGPVTTAAPASTPRPRGPRSRRIPAHGKKNRFSQGVAPNSEKPPEARDLLVASPTERAIALEQAARAAAEHYATPAGEAELNDWRG